MAHHGKPANGKARVGKHGKVSSVANRSPRKTGGKGYECLLARRHETPIRRDRVVEIPRGRKGVELPDLIREARSVWMEVQLEAYLAFTNGAESEYERLSEVALGMEEQIYRDCCIAGIANFNTRRILANA